MALTAKRALTEEGTSHGGLSANKLKIPQLAAARIATGYLIDNVGVLTSPGSATRVDDRWSFPILVGNVFQGSLGEIGTIEVDGHSGEVRLSNSSEELLANAERLYSGST
jgi:hypothetical protein